MKDAAPFGEVWVAHADGKVAAAAVWLPPGAYPRSLRRELMTNVRARSRRSCVRAAHRAARCSCSPRSTRPTTRSADRTTTSAILGSDPLFQRIGRRHRGARTRARTLRRRRAPRVPRDAEGREHRVLRCGTASSSSRSSRSPAARRSGPSSANPRNPRTGVRRRLRRVTDAGSRVVRRSTTSSTNFWSWRRLRTS